MEKQKILIVDDSEMNRALLVDILEEQYDVVEAVNGVEAISLLSRHRTDFSLLLLDIMMPKMDGFEVLAYINKYHWNDTFAVMMISADDSPANIKRAYDLGAFDYISRPFDSTIVLRRISNTMLLYARQQRLEKIIAEQFCEQEKNNKLMISILSHIVEFRNGESGRHILCVNTIMPHMTGYEAAKAIRELNRPDALSIPIIAMSADAFSDDIKHCLECGMNAHIAKPIDVIELTRLLKRYLI